MGRANVVDLSPSPELSYVIGAVLGDGTLYIHSRRHEISLTVKDRDFAEEFAIRFGKLLGRKLNIETRKMKGVKYYVVRAGSKNLFYFLKQDLDKLMPIVSEYPQEFLKGIFDAEGSVRLHGKDKEVKLRNKNIKLTEYIRKLLANLGIEARAYVYEGDIASLVIAKYDSIVEFDRKIGFRITRKQKKLTEIRQRRYRVNQFSEPIIK